ncbi:MAG TPA: alkaline phosphatase family protein, partial [Sumerlaeia bacterium]|nr:alkaline phosphatase family protein [Sumerlaeia bacterium]
IPTTVFRMPANFPPVPSSGKSLSGLGTPDLLGSMGTFSFFASRPPKNARNLRGGGEIVPVRVVDNRVDARLKGPTNTFRRRELRRGRGRASAGPRGKQNPQYENPPCAIDFTIFLDSEEAVAKVVVQDREFILKEGEWSDWIRVEFRPLPGLASVGGAGVVTATARFYLQQVRPDFRLYVSPLQIDPARPALPLSTPADWSRDLCEKIGPFYTQGLPEDTKALSGGIFTGREFWDQAQFVLQERRRALERLLEDFDEGLLFFYLSSLDQGTHMLWRYADREHPAFHSPSEPNEGLEDGIPTLYQQMDEILGDVRAAIDDETVLIVLSDHGFSPFYWCVNLNSWLLEKGYVRLRAGARQSAEGYFENVDWDRTTAYALGLNGVYVNQKGREMNGSVLPGRDYDDLLDRLEADLRAMRDPRNGGRPVSQVVRARRDFRGAHVDIGPDIIVGYSRGYRVSWESPLGKFPREIFLDNDDAWSADHCVDSQVVPGVLVANSKITLESPALCDVTVAVLALYGIDPLPEMIGRNCLAAGPLG